MSALQQSALFEIINAACVPESSSPAQMVRAQSNRWAFENKDRMRIIDWVATDSGGFLGYKHTIIYEVLADGDQPVTPALR